MSLLNRLNHQISNTEEGLKMANNKKYWQSIGDLNNDPSLIKKSQNEFAEEIPLDAFLSDQKVGTAQTPRRDFLKFLGFSVSAAALAACEAPVRKTVPYLVKPEEMTIGIANWYASTFDDGYDFCNILVKTREGRPVKIEGNSKASFTSGATNARTQASVLSLYDTARQNGPLKNNNQISWKEVDADIKNKLAAAAAAGGNIRVLTSTVTSPSLNAILEQFAAKYPGTKIVRYDAVSASAIREAYLKHAGKAIIPDMDFSAASVIVSFGADFLANWISPVSFSKQYGKGRKVSKQNHAMSRHYQFESLLSLTGSNADIRTSCKPSQLSAGILALYNAIASKAGQAVLPGKSVSFDKTISKAAEDLWKNKGKGLVVCGINDIAMQELVIGINSMLGNYGSTLDTENPLNLRQGSDKDVIQLVNEMKGGSVSALIVHNCNPVYTLPASLGFAEALKKVSFSVALSEKKDETASICQIVCPTNHYLESWGDASPKSNSYSLIQPAINPIYNTRQAAESIMSWAGIEGSYLNYLRSYWETNMFPKQNAVIAFDEFWTRSLHDGIFEMPKASSVAWNTSNDMASAAASVSPASAEWEITLHEITSMGNGSQANNPWLLEMPDPVSKVVWDNYIAMSPKKMQEMGLRIIQEKEEPFSVVELTVNGLTVKAPVFPQPGQPDGTIALAFGFGHSAIGKAADGIGSNAFAMLSVNGDQIVAHSNKVSLKVIDETYMLVSTQTHHTLMGRHMVKETTLSEYTKNPQAGNHKEELVVSDGHKHEKVDPRKLDLWATTDNPGFEKNGLFWNMSIDLSSCIGCGNCVVSCQAENNVAVVGKDEVRKSREMHWIRIDRYYSSDTTKENVPDGTGMIDTYKMMEIPSENPKVLFQPVMCQHCNHAPCETVCPVLATTHSTEGLNQMTYNRCVGTKYCANNCPYKVRRFNWFKYFDNSDFDFNMNNDLGKMVLNPDVTVRSRGVMEKCSMCIQRIQEGKLNAKKEGRKINDGEVKTACQQSCPTEAITFGNVNDQNSRIAAANKDERSYNILEELAVLPSVYYWVKVRNTDEPAHSAGHHA
ncbi:MAG: hypothetical protein RLZZ46_1243 [Bacteroidota bacterium]